MSDIYYVDIQDLSRDCTDVFLSLTEKYYECYGVTKTESEAKKHVAHDAIRNLFYAIEHRFEMLLYLKWIINDFDWDRYNRFDYYRELSKDKLVSQELQDGKMVIKFRHRETLENFIFTNVMCFLSNVSGIVDNLAFILKETFNLSALDNRIATIPKVYNEMPDGVLKDKLKHIVSDKDFAAMLTIRKLCEHGDHSQVFVWSDARRSQAIGSRQYGVPLVRKDLVDRNPEDRRIDNYCQFLYAKLYSFLKLFLTAAISLTRV